jgi:hypothetical protein
MMYGGGKSDSLVVPKKSSNKAGRPVAEGVEGRGLAKGNLEQRAVFRDDGDRERYLERLAHYREKFSAARLLSDDEPCPPRPASGPVSTVAVHGGPAVVARGWWSEPRTTSGAAIGPSYNLTP